MTEPSTRDLHIYNARVLGARAREGLSRCSTIEEDRPGGAQEAQQDESSLGVGWGTISSGRGRDWQPNAGLLGGRAAALDALAVPYWRPEPVHQSIVRRAPEKLV